jgi:hypothetical protein
MTTPENSEEFTPPTFDPGERSVEAPENVIDESRPAQPEDEDEEVRRGLEVGEYDAAEQAHVVILDEDYRE